MLCCSELEKYIRRKYEFRRFVERGPPPVPVKDPREIKSRSPSGASSNGGRSPVYRRRGSSPLGSPEPERRSLAPSDAARIQRPAPPPQQQQQQPNAALSVKRSQTAPPAAPANGVTVPSRESSRAAPPVPQLSLPAPPGQGQGQGQAQSQKPSNISAGLFDELVSLQNGPSTPQPPLQMNPWLAMHAQGVPATSPGPMSHLPNGYAQASGFSWATPSAGGASNGGYSPGADMLGQQAFGGMLQQQQAQHAMAFNGHGSNSPYAMHQQQPQQQQQSPFSASPGFGNPFTSPAAMHSMPNLNGGGSGFLTPFDAAQQQQQLQYQQQMQMQQMQMMQAQQQQQQATPFGYMQQPFHQAYQ